MLRKWCELEWRDPRIDLINLGKLQTQLEGGGIRPAVANLRERELRRYLEWRQAALFSYFVSNAVLNVPVAYSMVEDEDYDCLVRWVVDGTYNFAPVQLKEVVPKTLNPNAELNKELAKLEKYAGPSDTIVAVHLNQTGRLEFESIEVPKTGCKEIWIYGSLSASQAVWFLYGNVLHDPWGHEIAYPT